MEINLKKLGEQAIESTTTTKKMRLSEDAQSMVFQLFTKNVYSNPIGTVVREITSNCFDSHVEAGVNDMPVVIRKSHDNETDTYYISFIDYGVGMSPERVDNIYSVYFESTKRVDNTQIGGFGIGGKTPLAYKRSTGLGEGEYDNSFYVITNHDGTKYFYMVYEGAESPEVTLLHKESTEDGNGTEIKIPVSANDLKVFEREMLKQLYYFENIVFEGFDDCDYVTNDYKIVRGKSFYFRGNDYNSNMHVCLGRVAYPIDFNALGLQSGDFAIPVAIKLNVGDINVTVSRESLDYSEKTIKLLKDKLEEVKTELVGMVSKQYANITSLEDYFNAKHNFGYLSMTNGNKIHMANIMSIKDIDFSNFKYNHLKMPSDKQLFNLFFSTKIYGKRPAKSSWRRKSHEVCDGSYETIMSQDNIYYIDRDLERKIIKQRYLSTIHGTYFIVRHANLFDWEKKEQIMSLFNMKIGTPLFDDKGQPNDIMLDILNLREDLFNIIQKYREDYHTLEVPEDFKMPRKGNALTADILERKINVKIMGSWGKVKMKVKELIDFNNIIFYATQDDENEIKNAYRIHKTLFDNVATGFCTYYKNYEYLNNNKKSGIMFVMAAKNNLKYFEYCKQAYSIKEYYWKMLHRKKDMIMSYFKDADVIERYNQIDRLFKNPKFGLVSDYWGKHIETLNAEIEKFKEQTNTGIGELKYHLQRYFEISDTKPTANGKRLLKMIDDLETLDKVNDKILRYVRVDYNGNYLDTEPELVEILKKVMIL